MSRTRESKPHIGIFGRRNHGKSSLINMLTGQSVAIVSEQAGTTTDPVRKSMEIPGVGPVVLIDTAGIDDTGELGGMRAGKSLETTKQIDLAVLVIANNLWGEWEDTLAKEFIGNETPFIVAHTKHDIEPIRPETYDGIRALYPQVPIVEVSPPHRHGLSALIDAIGLSIPESSLRAPTLLGNLVGKGDIVLLVTPIDMGAPAGRLILPQVQAIRDALDNDAVAIVLKEGEVDAFLGSTGIKPALAVTDSQVFARANVSIPMDIPLTSFSILLARLKGDFESYLKGTPRISTLKDGDRVLLLESCTHHVSCDDIGRVKIPRWMSSFTGKRLEYDVVAGLDKLPIDIGRYALVLQCGGCMITPKQIRNRLRPAIEAGVPVTNYGMAIAYVQGIYQRAIAPFTGEGEGKVGVTW